MDEPEGQGEAMDSQYQEPNINNANVKICIIFYYFQFVSTCRKMIDDL